MDQQAAQKARRAWNMGTHQAAAPAGDESTARDARLDLRDLALRDLDLRDLDLRRLGDLGGSGSGSGSASPRTPSRTYDQSMSGRNTSQRTAPPDSLSIATASPPPSLLPTMIALRKYPNVVRQRRAKAVRSVCDSDLRYARSVSITPNVPKGIYDTSPKGHVPMAGTLRYYPGMTNDTNAISRVHEVRRARMRLLLERYPTMTAFAEAIGETLNYTSRLVKLQKVQRRNLGEGKARKIEAMLGLPERWLDQDMDSTTKAPPIGQRTSTAWPFSPRLPRAAWDNLSFADQRRVETMMLTFINGIEAERALEDKQDTG